MSPSRFALAAAVAVLSSWAHAAEMPGLRFSHNDWELVCDNTRTCRAAGYHSDGDEMAVSVLFTRPAGPHQPVTGQLMIGRYGENSAVDRLPPKFALSLRINKQAVGQVAMGNDSLVADLSSTQVAALLAALRRDAAIEFVTGPHRWRLSDKGAAAVLLKMDEFQGRLGTPGALVKKGARSEDTVLPSLPPLKVTSVAPVAPRPGDDRIASKNSKAIRQALRATIKEGDDCYLLMEDAAGERELVVRRLTAAQLLVSTQCWSAAYNFGSGYWVVDDTPPFRAVLVTTSGSDFGDRSITATHKGRGLGDCWSVDEWVWNGRQFVHSESSTSGMCKLMAPGGAWTLPTITSITSTAPTQR